MNLVVEALPAFSDNYIWLLHDGRDAAVVDPGQAGPVLEALGHRGLSLRAILLTHHHADHIGGVEALLQKHPAPVHGPPDPRIPQVDHPCHDGDVLRLAAPALSLTVLEVPGHTRSHIAFHGQGHLFCGDTLFSVGCGRLFEGTPADMQASLDKLAALPDDTLVHCAHEYTEANCAFARRVEPDNAALAARADEVRRLRAAGTPTVPSRLGDERRYNPFLRTREPAVIRAARGHAPDCDGTPAAVLGAIRAWKDAG